AALGTQAVSVPSMGSRGSTRGLADPKQTPKATDIGWRQQSLTATTGLRQCAGVPRKVREVIPMKKKLLVGLAPLVVVAALLVMPAASQAACTAPNCPHVYKNGVKSAEGKELHTLAWGTLHLKTTVAIGEVECRNVFTGVLENPVGGGQAKGLIEVF